MHDIRLEHPALHVWRNFKLLISLFDYDKRSFGISAV